MLKYLLGKNQWGNFAKKNLDQSLWILKNREGCLTQYSKNSFLHKMKNCHSLKILGISGFKKS